MSDRYCWRNWSALDSFSTDRHGGHVLDSPTGYRWHCTRCGMTREGVHRIDFYTKGCD